MELEPFLTPADESNSSGLELRNDVRFHALERLMEPAVRSVRLENVKSGGAGTAAVDWAEILSLAADLARVGRDLRLLVIVVRALANVEGFAGLERGLVLLTDTIDRYWDTVHPVLRDAPMPREAATRRINSLYQLENSDNGLICDLEFLIVLNPRGIGPITVGDLCAGGLNRNAARAEMPSGLGDKEMAELLARHDTRVNRVAAACRAQAIERPEDLATLIASIEGAKVALIGLEDALGRRVGENGLGVKFRELEKILNRTLTPLRSAQANADPGAAAAEQTGIADPSGPAQAVNSALQTTQPASGGIPGSVNSRRDVERCLDMIINFYERTEPSSPIPHLARRMRKMVPMNFMQLMEEIAPSGMKEFKNIAGVDDKTKTAAQ